MVNYDQCRVDEIGFGNLKVIQNPAWFCYGVDAVLLADFAKESAQGNITDLGVGTGIIPLILSHKANPGKIIGVEAQEQVAELAIETVKLNGLEEKIEILHMDVKNAAAQIGKSTQHMVLTNPPYQAKGEGMLNQVIQKAAARHELLGTLEEFIVCAKELLVDGGDFFMVHRPHRLVDVISLCRVHGLEPKELQFVQPTEGKKANIFLIHCVKWGKPELRLFDPLCIYDCEGNYTPALLKIYEEN